MNNTPVKLMTLCLALAGLFLIPFRAHALEFNLVDGEPIHTQAQLDSLHTGDTVIMTCTHCKAGTMTTYSSDPNSPNHLQWMKPGFTKTCPMCGGTLTTVKKGDKTEIICSKCGSMGFVNAYHTGKS